MTSRARDSLSELLTPNDFACSRPSVGVADWKNTRAAIVGGRDDDVVAAGVDPGRTARSGAQHRVGELLRIAQSDGGDRGPRPTKKTSERSGIFRGYDHVIEERHQFFAEGLVQIIAKRALEISEFAGGEGGGNGRCVAATRNGARAADVFRQERARLRRADLEVGN